MTMFSAVGKTWSIVVWSCAFLRIEPGDPAAIILIGDAADPVVRGIDDGTGHIDLAILIDRLAQLAGPEIDPVRAKAPGLRVGHDQAGVGAAQKP